MARIVLNPANLHEPSRSALFSKYITGGEGGYWQVGNGSRYIFTTTATNAKVTFAQDVSQICYRVNGFDYWVNAERNGANVVNLPIPLGDNKRFELIMPAEGLTSFGGTVVGTYPVEIEFNNSAAIVLPTPTGTNRVIYGDSITSGTGTNVGMLQGYVGLMKRGSSDPFLPTWKGAYNAGTLYAAKTATARLGDVVSYNGSTWEKKSSAAAGTTPAIGSDWDLRGFVGKVTQISYGSRRLQDDCSTGGLQTAFATYIASLNPTELIMLIGTNDWVIGGGGWSAASFQTAYTGLLNALAATSASAIPVRCVSPLLTASPNSREGANSAGSTMDDYRAAVAAAVAATTKSNVTHVTGKTILTANDLFDGIHPWTGGFKKLRNALL